MNDTNKGVNPFWTTLVYPNLLKHDLLSSMYTKSLNRTSNIIKTSSINVDVLKQNTSPDIRLKRTCINTLNKRLHDSKKKDKLKNMVIVSSVLLSVGALSFIVG